MAICSKLEYIYNFIMYLCEFENDAYRSVTVQKYTEQGGWGRGVAKGNIIDTEQREELSGKASVILKIWISISTISRYIQCSRSICDSESLISRCSVNV